MTGKLVFVFKSGVERTAFGEQDYLAGIAEQIMHRRDMTIKIDGDSATWLLNPSEVACVELSNAN